MYYVRDFDTGELVLTVSTSMGNKQIIRFEKGLGIQGHVIETLRSENCRSATTHPNFSPVYDVQTGYQATSILCMPVLDPNKADTAVGVVEVRVGG